MGVWSERSFEKWYQSELAGGTWEKGRDGDSEGLKTLAERHLFDSEAGERYFRAVREMGVIMLANALQIMPNVAAPAIDHLRAAALVSVAASIIPPHRGTLDDDLNGQTIENIRWAEGTMQRMHIISIARVMQAVSKSLGTTGF